MDFCTIRDERVQTEKKVFKVVPRSDVNEMVFNIRHSLSRSAFERTKLDANLTTCFQDRGKYEKVRRNDVSGGVNFPSLCERRTMIDYISIVCVS